MRRSIRLTVTRGILSGQDADCMNTFRFLSFPMVQIQSIILTAPDGMRKRSMRNGEQVRQRPVTVLNLPASGQMPITV